MNPVNCGITVSIVSHGQASLLSKLLEDLAGCDSVSRIVLTLNIPEANVVIPKALEARTKLIFNKCPKGFGANHNHAFQYCETSFFVVLNPDLRLFGDSFLELAHQLMQSGAGLVTPKVLTPDGRIEDNARIFPTPLGLARKLLGIDDGRAKIYESSCQEIDWAAGMFLMFSADVYRSLSGFDEGFYLYYEDVDICARLWGAGIPVIYDPSVNVVHEAQRASRRNLRYLRWHLVSMMRYFVKHLGRFPR
jgi:N-acetylglucosaminyl-diphospho-decaprenol L-rhamnosyltransferase